MQKKLSNYGQPTLKGLKLLLILLFVSLLDLRAQTAIQPVGVGTEISPYQIASLENLYWLSLADTAWDKYYLQTADIDASDTKNWNVVDGDTLGFSPIGNDSMNFTGNYSGAGYSIFNLYIDQPFDEYIGLFGQTNGAVVDGLGLVDVDITGDYYVGGLVGYNSFSTITNCFKTGQVLGYGIAGGLIGYNASSEIFNNYCSGDVFGNYHVGGLVGYNSSSELSNNYSTGCVYGQEYIGGLVGYNNRTEISNNYSVSYVLGLDNVGGLIGANNNSIIINSYYNIETSVLVEGIGENNNNQTVVGLTINQMKSGESFEGWDFEDVWSITRGGSFPRLQSLYNPPIILRGANKCLKVNEKYIDTLRVIPMDYEVSEIRLLDAPSIMTIEDSIITMETDSIGIYTFQVKVIDNEGIGVDRLCKLTVISFVGEGTELSPYQITSIDDLNLIRELPDKCYLLMNDLDFSNTTYDRDNSERGWEPIGNFITPFSGNFNGNNHVISNLYINRPDDYEIGLFGYAYESEIDSLGLVNVDIAGLADVGGLVGYNYTSLEITHAFCTGKVTGNGSVGGLVGFNLTSDISYSYSTCNVFGVKNVGGLVGMNWDMSKISRCYSTGNVYGKENVGGLIGSNTSSQIMNSYSVGYVIGIENIGGFLGRNSSSFSTISNSYYNIESSGQSEGIGFDENNLNVNGLTTSQMKISTNFSNWDFNSIWTIRTDSTYPALMKLDNAPFAFPDTVTGSLYTLLQNDYDYETLHENLVIKVDSAILLPYGTSYITDLTSLTNGDSIKIIYHAGEIRKEKNDTLFSGAVVSYLNINNSIPVTTDTLETMMNETLTILKSNLATDGDNDMLFFTVFDSTNNGQFSVNGNQLIYRPNINFSGLDSFKIEVSDQLCSIEGWIYIKVKSDDIGSNVLNDNKRSIKLYPNPVSTSFQIVGFDDIAVLYLYNAQGLLVFERKITEGQTITIDNLQVGIYVSKIMLSDGNVIKTIIKTE